MRKKANALSLVLALVAASCDDTSRETSREDLVSGYDRVLEFWDRDDDQKLNQSEIEAMIDENIMSFGGDVPLGFERDDMLRFYADQDLDGDNNLSLEELVAEPLATFDCIDTNADGRLSEDEVLAGMSNCASSLSIGN